MNYKILFTKQAKKDYDKIAVSSYKDKALRLLCVLEQDPLQPPYEKLVDHDNVYSRRINLQHRLVYEIIESQKAVKIIRMWTHYGDN